MDTSVPPRQSTSALGCLSRLAWIAMLPAGLVLCLVAIAESSARSLSRYDLFYGVILLAFLLSRVFDVKVMKGTDGEGLPVTDRSLVLWTAAAAALGGGAWAGVHGIAALLGR